MLFDDRLVLVRGGGDLGTGAVARLHRSGFPIVVLELARPLTIRRTVAVSSAVNEGRVQVEDLDAIRTATADEAVRVAQAGKVAVLVDPTLPVISPAPSVVVDARLAKRPLDTRINDASLVVGLGPGFVAGVDCHAVVETERGHHLGRVIWDGPAAPDTGVPGVIGGESTNRIVRAHRSGVLAWTLTIGDVVGQGDTLGAIDGEAVVAGSGGVVRGLLADGEVSSGWKIADVDPRAEVSACHEISDKSLSVGGGVLEAMLTWMNRHA